MCRRAGGFSDSLTVSQDISYLRKYVQQIHPLSPYLLRVLFPLFLLSFFCSPELCG